MSQNQKPGNNPDLEKKRSRSEKAILGATPGIPGHSRSNSRNGSHDLIYVKTLFSEQLSERLSELVGRQNFSPNSRSVFFKIGVVPAHQKINILPPKLYLPKNFIFPILAEIITK